MIKFGIAALLAVIIVYASSWLPVVLPSDLLAYLVAGAVALLCVGMTTTVSKTNWVTMAVLLVAGAGLYWGLQIGLGAYVMVAGLGVLAGIIAMMLPVGNAPVAAGGH